MNASKHFPSFQSFYDRLHLHIRLFMILVLINIVFPSIQQLFTGSLILAQATGFFMVTFPVSLYFIISDSVIGGQSIGKRKVGIQVVNKNNTSVSVKQMVYRTVLKFLPWELSHFLAYHLVYIGDGEVPFRYYLIGGLIYFFIFVYIFTAIFTKEKRALYDKFARTKVIKTEIQKKNIEM
ncbi:RDD family protein [Paenibacillus nasutitermitis]|uniref:RDD domain-containing protein n=1 Tax=Paenibacillus nasutitermitis TaxID=1652958 RepID=A0A917DRK3_9BACL|nr:RDD family protein [Paenibacillus nasutitermitis]GGD60249.1 hypothetical protein GCM10010911_17650 [Paenibacillus nasutitermitis]